MTKVLTSLLQKSSLLYLLLLLTIGQASVLRAQNESLNLKGFIEYANMTYAPAQDGKWLETSDIHNRIDLHWYAGKQFTFYTGIRNNFDFGSMLSRFYPDYKDFLLRKKGFLDLSFAWGQGRSYLFYTHIDRLHMKWMYKKLEVTLGRQRINWGLNSIWNPNDIFNTYNFFDFGYIERPGSDALHLQYYTGPLSSLQIAAKINRENQLTAAALYKFNYKSYDIQLMSGIMNHYFVVGGGWAGQIKGAGFTGEVNYFSPTKKNMDPSGQWVASIAGNYTFTNQLYLNLSLLYNSKGKAKAPGQRNFLQMDELTPQSLTLSKLNAFGELSYPITPLLKADLSVIWNPYDRSAFLGPSLDFSLTENIELYAIAQLFTGRTNTEYAHFGEVYYLRLKWSF